MTLTLSGSDHKRSHSSPWSGTSVGLMIRRICSMLCRSGLSPPWQQKIFSSTIAATGKQLKQSVNVFHNLILYRRLPETEARNQYSLVVHNPNMKNSLKLTFIVETIYPVDWCTFMVASQKEKVFWVLDLVSQQKANCFQRLFPSVNIVSKEQVVGFRREATIFKQTE